ncbi:MarR family winged helix-turn-helix transcriptional regulator [Pusillimonas noertemannii]|uniref:MarR family winged helix-turn-helix transcriptional regulator n=1 Tax=Pusillimonas noertemannii TaxID=305977 RepID=UPI0009FD5AD0|nr:MarR family transcriptional regulator [Pusillimonas noertemannii]
MENIHIIAGEVDMIAGGVWSRPGFLIRRLHQIHYTMFYEETKGDSITPLQYGVLTTLAAEPWLDQTTIGNELGLDRATTAGVLNRLEGKGWIKRRVNQSDKRSRQAMITKRGMTVITKLQVCIAVSQHRLMQPLSIKEQKDFMGLLRKLVQANNQYGRTMLKAF